MGGPYGRRNSRASGKKLILSAEQERKHTIAYSFTRVPLAGEIARATQNRGPFKKDKTKENSKALPMNCWFHLEAAGLRSWQDSGSKASGS